MHVALVCQSPRSLACSADLQSIYAFLAEAITAHTLNYLGPWFKSFFIDQRNQVTNTEWTNYLTQVSLGLISAF